MCNAWPCDDHWHANTTVFRMRLPVFQRRIIGDDFLAVPLRTAIVRSEEDIGRLNEFLARISRIIGCLEIIDDAP